MRGKYEYLRREPEKRTRKIDPLHLLNDKQSDKEIAVILCSAVEPFARTLIPRSIPVCQRFDAIRRTTGKAPGACFRSWNECHAAERRTIEPRQLCWRTAHFARLKNLSHERSFFVFHFASVVKNPRKSQENALFRDVLEGIDWSMCRLA